MNRNNAMWVLLMTLFLGVSFTSCEIETETYYGVRTHYSWWNDSYERPSSESVAMANMLKGTWRGATETRYRDDFGDLKIERFNTEIEFKQDYMNAIYGSGIQRDYDGNRLSAARSFTWRLNVVSGNILIEYNKANGSTYIMELPYNDLHLDNRSFSGVMVSRDEQDDFDYRRIGFRKMINISKE